MFYVIGILVVTFVVCFLISYIYVVKFIVGNSHNQTLFFSGVFGLSNILLMSLMIEIAQIDDDKYINMK